LIQPLERDRPPPSPQPALARADREHAARRQAHHALELPSREVHVVQHDERASILQVSLHLRCRRDHRPVALVEALEEKLQDVLPGLALRPGDDDAARPAVPVGEVAQE